MAALPGADDLIILRLQLRRMADAGELDEETYRRLSEQVDAQWRAVLEAARIQPDSTAWRERCRAAWRVLAAHGHVPFGPSPWEEAWGTAQLGLDLEPPATPPVPVSAPSPAATEPRPIAAATPETPARAFPAPARAPAARVAARRTEVVPETGTSHAWRPAEPSPLEKALRAVSGWPRAILPFLAQNIGWFIGGFLFLAGSVFLVAYTSGFIKGLVVFAALFAYTTSLLWGGYQLRLREPALRTGSATLMTLGLLLVPLNLSAVARLIVAGAGSFWLEAVGLLTAALAVGVFLFAAQVVAGVTDRALQGAHPRVFLGLSSVQLALPLLDRWPAWPLLAALHLSLLGLLGYGLVSYARDWMRSIFVERRTIAYFAAGTLIYAALISFVHLTWGAVPLALPAGYYAPYLMTVCGLLFYLDAQFKEWVHQHAFLSRFSFLIYGLSVLAVALALDAPTARLITLVLAAAVYGTVAWRYLTLVPVYLLLASLGSLYGLLILQPLPADQHFLGSLPGLAGMLALSRWAQGLAARRPGARAIAAMIHRVLFGLGLGLAAWSLYHARPGLPAMTTALVLAAAAWWMLGAAPAPLLGRLEGAQPESQTPPVMADLRNGPWLYAVTLAMSAAAAYAPPWIHLMPGLRVGLAFALLAWVWTWRAVNTRRRGPQAARIEVYANSALLSVAVGLVLAVPVLPLTGTWAALLALVLADTAGVLVWLSLGLYVRWLFYGFLVLAGGAAVLIKLAFFPGPSTGAPALIAGLAVWGLLWWLDRQPDALEALRAEKLPRPLTLLWVLPAAEGFGVSGQRRRGPLVPRPPGPVTREGSGDV